MSIQSTLRYTCILVFSFLLFGAINAKAQVAAIDTMPMVPADSAVIDTPKAPKIELGSHQLTIGINILRPVINAYSTDKYGYEFAADYYLKNELYLAAEGGWGTSTVTYTDLKYNTSNYFFRAGFNKYLFPRQDAKDWGGLFMGLRLATAGIDRSAATYTVIDSLWGNNTGSLAGKSFNAYWMEITAGVRVELYKGLMAGWNIRGKFLLNGKSFNDLSPLYVAGYGRGDKTSAFDFNFYLSYAVRWKRH
ncbi:hypothetical protein CJD36_005335 [Flavipsychrobacter stenotrophus]|uniref:DUF3575 domain-containing protein n=1 Tax=Flavipsychrobacter stenotrophus TaxID=2077091 RepID=A0A2S7SWC4_9BACT|nr:DUF6048 family protein [Flavipsychrobacter stenotrophus]PQJ11230.1 hypothetical protein CJD36_005335 [Flavipsychrobacter stenotrophus]